MKDERSKKGDSREFYVERELKKIADRWNAKAADWDRNLEDPTCHLNEDNAYARFLDALAREVAQRQNFCREQGVIDVGCGTGVVLGSIVSNFAWGLGIDISPDMVRLAQGKAIPNARFTVGDCFHLSALARKAGAVVSRGVLLSHYGRQHAAAFLESLRAALAPAGFVLCDFLSQTGKDKFEHFAPGKTYYTKSEICQLAGAAGFRTARVLNEPERRVQVLLCG